MEIHVLDLENKRQIREFLELPFRIYAHIPQWVPPLEADARRMLDRRRNPFFRHGEAQFLLAREDGQVVGRLAVLENRKYNEFNREKTAFFYLFECENSPQAARGLFETAFEWARGRGLEKIAGPKGFSALDGLGLLVRGFEYRPAFGLPYNPPYYVDLIESLGFQPVGETVSGYLDETMQFPAKIHELAERVMQRRGLRVTRFKSRRELRQVVPYFRDLYNASLGGTEGTAPISEEEARTMAEQLIWFADPALVKLVMKDEQPVGFLLGYPDISRALQRTKGRLWPFGWLVMLWELWTTREINLNGAGMIEGYRGVGGTALLFSEMYKSVVEGGRYRYADLVQIGVENSAMQREMANFGIVFHKTHRMYERVL